MRIWNILHHIKRRSPDTGKLDRGQLIPCLESFWYGNKYMMAYTELKRHKSTTELEEDTLYWA